MLNKCPVSAAILISDKHNNDAFCRGLPCSGDYLGFLIDTKYKSFTLRIKKLRWLLIQDICLT
jgi:hypothetical protein